MPRSKLNYEDFGPVSTFSTSILSSLVIGLLIQNFIGYAPWPVITFVLIGIYDGFRRMWNISSKLEKDIDERRN
jgi:F0F1-type ATP synthase assembly protein I